MTLCLQGRQLGCERDDRWLFSGLDIEINHGEILRVTGPNGSGKTTLLKILAGQLNDFSGALHWNGQPLSQVSEQFAANMLYLGHAPGVSAWLTPLENLAWYQALQGERGSEEQREAALARMGLQGLEDTPIGHLSAGQQRRVALTRLSLTPRALWVLDEPFTAIDQAGVDALEAQLAAHADAGGAVVVTTHHALNNARPLCHIALG
ncbi:cytochrome c biogenesis heme-transporting ATPase CcmA [Vreelandella arcis]|uniref:Heme exporter protein A n=1 Tax=Vreelandella arcis TaxID=416873 RepID=A0A1H0D9I6_9GAMM|nr:cytochrome c biogenesis heme-transporting ATPase CcmA [Halomonas arcis]SDN66641.1 heme exporter protein A [Halomonas arcis]